MEKYYPFDLNLGNAAYWDFWLRIAEEEGNVFCYNPNPAWLYRIEMTSRHVLRENDNDKIVKNHKEKLAMLEKHINSLTQYDLTCEMQKFEEKIRELNTKTNNRSIKIT